MRTLILDKNFMPVKVVCWKKAIVLMILEKGNVLEFYDSFIKTPNMLFKVPKIFMVRGGVSKKILKLSPTRRNIFKRDNNRCAYCGDFFSYKELTVDHIIPKCKGGDNSWINLITSCNSCNNKKGDKTPEQANMPLMFKPLEPEWSPKMGLKINQTEESLFEYYIRY